MRGAPQRKFARAISEISWRVSAAILGRPPRQRPRDRYFQTRRYTLTAPTQDRVGFNDGQGFGPARPHHDRNTQNNRSIAQKHRASHPAALKHYQLMPQPNALPDQIAPGSTICPGPPQRYQGAV